MVASDEEYDCGRCGGCDEAGLVSIRRREGFRCPSIEDSNSGWWRLVFPCSLPDMYGLLMYGVRAGQDHTAYILLYASKKAE